MTVQLPKAYLRLDPNIDQTHPDNLDGFIRLLCAANRQPVRGRFRSRAILDNLFGKTAVDKLIGRGDVRAETDGTVSVPGWDTWQEGDLSVKERMKRYRARNGAVTQGVTGTVTGTVTESSPDRHGMSEALGHKGVRASNDVTPSPRKRGRRSDDTNPRAVGENPRAVGESPRQSGTSPRQEREAEKRGGLQALKAVMDGIAERAS